MNNKKLINEILQRFYPLESERTKLETEWQELSDIFQPGVQNFSINQHVIPWTQNYKSIDPMGKYLCQKLVAKLFGLLTNPSLKWFQFTPVVMSSTSLVIPKTSELYLETISKTVLNVLNNVKSNFVSSIQEVYHSIIVFGPGVLYVENRGGTNIVFKSIPLSQVYISENDKGIVDTIFRKFEFSAKQAVQAFGIDNVSENVKKCYDKSPEDKFEFLHCVYPNNIAKKKQDKYVEYYIDKSNNTIVYSGTTNTFNFIVPRWTKFTGEKYGHGQGKLALPLIRSMTHIRKENHKTLEFTNNPILLESDDGVLIPDELRPGSRIQGAINSMDGTRRLETFSPTGNPQAGLQMYEIERQMLEKVFFTEDSQYPVDSTRRTATEAQFIQQDRMQFLAPFVSRIESDLLKPMLETVLAMLFENGLFPDVPQDLLDIEFDTEFLSPLARVLKMEDTRATQQFLQMSLPLVQLKPEILQMINFEEVIRDAQKGTGSPASVIKSDEEYQQTLQVIQQQQQNQLNMQSALQASEITKNVSQANRNNPNEVL